MEEIKHLTEYYGQYDEENRLLSKHGQVEYLTTLRYVEKYLRKGAHILEIGAGTGRYCVELARQVNILQGIADGKIDSDTFKCLSKPSLLFELYRKGDA